MTFRNVEFTRTILGLEVEVSVTFETDTIREMVVKHQGVELTDLNEYGYTSMGRTVSFESILEDAAYDEKVSQRE